MELNYRRTRVFDQTPEESYTPTKILDLKLCWTPEDKTETALPDTLELAAGETKLAVDLTAATDKTAALIFYGRHPLYENTYYKRIVTIDENAGEGREAYLTAGKVFYVNGEVYYLKTTVVGGDLYSFVDNHNYFLIDFSKSEWLPSTPYSLIEPFNVIFMPDSSYIDYTLELLDSSRVITATQGNINITNTPLDAEGKPLPVKYSFVMTERTLKLTAATEKLVGDTTTGIRSINGVLPRNGNINIKVLNTTE